MNKILLFLFACLFISNVSSQVKVANVKLYKTSEDFFENKTWDVDTSILIKEEGDRHLFIEDFIIPKTRQKFEEGISAWAIEYRGDKYFNMAYHIHSRWRVYVKFDIIGEYSAIFLDKNTDEKVARLDSAHYGGGLFGVLLQNLEKSSNGKNNIDSSGELRAIYIIDSNQVYPKNGYKLKGSKARLFDQNELKRLYRKRYPERKLKAKDRKKISFNDIINLIEELNQK